jgi:death-on-curing protein
MSRPLCTLSVDEVLKIHEILVADFARSSDPIVPSGPRSEALLDSAVHRQWTSNGGRLKYPDATGNASTLVFGVCCDHPFHNGNKRTSLVAMLAHLDKNGLCLYRTKQDDLYRFMIAIADHSIGGRPPSPHRQAAQPHSADEQVAAIAAWLKPRIDQVHRGEKQIAYRQLRQILAGFGFELSSTDSNRCEVSRIEQQTTGLLRRGSRTVKKRVGLIGYRNEGTVVSIADLKAVRRMCNLTEDDGYDTDAFYHQDMVVDAFVNQYRRVLYRLGKM